MGLDRCAHERERVLLFFTQLNCLLRKHLTFVSFSYSMQANVFLHHCLCSIKAHISLTDYSVSNQKKDESSLSGLIISVLTNIFWESSRHFTKLGFSFPSGIWTSFKESTVHLWCTNILIQFMDWPVNLLWRTVNMFWPLKVLGLNCKDHRSDDKTDICQRRKPITWVHLV